MTLSQTDIKQIEEIVKKTMEEELPNLLGRSLVQIREYFNKNIV